MLYHKPSPSRKTQPLDFFLDASFTNKRFQTDEMINCTPFTPEATLEVSNKTITFQKPYQAGIKGSVTVRYIFVYCRLLSLFAKNL